ncbi:hypothetical protein [Bacillus sp. 1P06AnD]|uniref:hypothetical protein n=1 Tax=Bacillus sp. 1P06AnD TaxID=3132208 RepID=UPI0039A1FEAC
MNDRKNVVIAVNGDLRYFMVQLKVAVLIGVDKAFSNACLKQLWYISVLLDYPFS